jgi:hypothetical protein
MSWSAATCARNSRSTAGSDAGGSVNSSAGRPAAATNRSKPAGETTSTSRTAPGEVTHPLGVRHIHLPVDHFARPGDHGSSRQEQHQLAVEDIHRLIRTSVDVQWGRSARSRPDDEHGAGPLLRGRCEQDLRAAEAARAARVPPLGEASGQNARANALHPDREGHGRAPGVARESVLVPADPERGRCQSVGQRSCARGTRCGKRAGTPRRDRSARGRNRRGRASSGDDSSPRTPATARPIAGPQAPQAHLEWIDEVERELGANA